MHPLNMENMLEKFPAPGTATSLMLTHSPAFALVPTNIRSICYILGQQSIKTTLDKAREAIRREVEADRKLRSSYVGVVPHPRTWVTIFMNYIIDEFDGELTRYQLKARLSLMPKAGSRLAGQANNLVVRYKVTTKDQATQTDPDEDPCPLCLRHSDRQYSYAGPRPSVVGPTPANARFRDACIEAPDRTYYGSHQLVYFRFGNFVYRGWTYLTLDGKIEHVPRIPRGIPIDQLRVEKPLRTPGPF